MIRWLAERLLAMIPTLLGITFVTFLVVDLAPGDPGTAAAGEAETGGDRGRAARAVEAKKRLLGLVREDPRLRAWKVDGEAAFRFEGARGEGDRWTRALAAGQGVVVAGGDDGIVRAYGVDGAVRFEATGHRASVRAVALSPDGARIASADASGDVRLWEAATGDPVAGPVRSGAGALDLAFLGGRLLVAGDDGVIRALALPDLGAAERYSGHVAGVRALAADPEGDRFWSGGADRVLREWEAGNTEPVWTSGAHGQAVNELALSPDGRWLASASDDRAVRVFDTRSRAVRVVGSHHREATAAAFAGGLLFSGGLDGTVRAWDPGSGAALAETAEDQGSVAAIAPGPDGTAWVASESWSKVPAPVRYLTWLGRVCRFDFDRSFTDNQPVVDKIARALPVTVGLNLAAIAVIYLVSVPLGVLAAVRRGRAFDHVSTVLLFLLYSIPSFWLATLLVLAFSSRRALDLLPAIGLHSAEADDLSFLPWLWDLCRHAVLPEVVLVYAGLASLSRYVRSSMLEVIGEDYIRTARAKGLSESVVVLRHALRNALVTIVTLVGELLPALVGGSVVVEWIFDIPGMGLLGYEAIRSRDYPVIMGVTTLGALLTLAGVLLSDLLYAAVDPRVGRD